MLARKINRSKWAPKAYLKADAIRADAVTNDLKTTDDKLSLWRCEDDPQDLDHVFLALATGPKSDRFDRMDIVVVPEKEIEDAGLKAEAKEGDTAVQDLRSRHVDLVELDFDKLGTFARILAYRVKNSQFKLLTKAEIKRLVRNAVSGGRVQPSELNEKLREKLGNGTPVV